VEANFGVINSFAKHFTGKDRGQLVIVPVCQGRKAANVVSEVGDGLIGTLTASLQFTLCDDSVVGLGAETRSEGGRQRGKVSASCSW